MLVIMSNNSCYTDMKNDSIVLQMISFAMWGKMLTGPWMGLFYGNPDSLNHLEFVPSMKTCLQHLKLIKDKPGRLNIIQNNILDNNEIIIKIKII